MTTAASAPGHDGPDHEGPDHDGQDRSAPDHDAPTRYVVTRTVPAAPSAVFALLTDPARHHETEPTDWVRGPLDPDPAPLAALEKAVVDDPDEQSRPHA